jgi:hypothetical protein
MWQISSRQRAWVSVLGFVMMAGALVVLTTGCGKTVSAASAPSASGPAKIALTIVAQRPGSSIDGPSYMPSTALVVPAHTLVEVTIVNQDAGDTPLPANSPYGKVMGVTGGHAYVDGLPYSSLDISKVAHTFTIPQLGINVPIPGDAPAGHSDITVTFSFMSGDSGKYFWQCMDPCGGDPAGWGGPMATRGYMMGTLTVE